MFCLRYDLTVPSDQGTSEPAQRRRRNHPYRRNRHTDVVLTLPANRIEAFRASALALYVTKADAVHQAGSAYLKDRVNPAPARRHRAELIEMDRIVEQVGWGFLKRPRRASVAGDPQLLREIVLDSLGFAIESVEDAWEQHRDSRAAGRAIRAKLRDVEALLQELDQLSSAR